MKLKDLRDLLNKMGDRHDEDEVLVEVYRKNSMGGTPAVKVRSANSGFDWDNGRFIIQTENPVMEITKNKKRDMQIDDIIG
jgi:hypothetical protein